MNNQQAIAKAQDIRAQRGGTIFSFPIREEDPTSPYAVVVFTGGMFHVYPEAENIQVAAIGVQTLLEEMKERGYSKDYETDVRFWSYEAQLNAPDVTMRRIKKVMERPTAGNPCDWDYQPKGGSASTGEEDYEVSGRGALKLAFAEMRETNHHAATELVNEYFKLLSMRRYGKTAAAIKQEVRRMSTADAMKWIDKTFKRYMGDGSEIISIFNRLAAKKG